jgi:hypothetical protein
MNGAHASPENEAFGLSLVRDDPAFRMQRRIGLIPKGSLGIVRRAVFWSLLAWLPIAVWAWYRGRAGFPPVDESVLAHFGVHSRLLLAVPLFILAEGMAHGISTRLLPYFVTSGVVPPTAVPGFKSVLAGAAKMRNATLPWVAILAVVLAVMTVSGLRSEAHELKWAVEGEGSARHLGFGAWWLVYVGRPIFLALLLIWFWRVVLMFVLFRRIAKLPLSIVATHPDRAGGLGFLGRLPVMFAPVVFAIASVLASGWAHDVVYHEVAVRALQWEMVAFVIAVLVLFLSPLLVFAGVLGRAKKQALLEYGALVGQHGRLVRERWIDGQEVKEDAVLNAPELGPIADTTAIYEAVQKMRPVPFSKSGIASLTLAAAVPMLAVLSIQIPIVELVKRLLGALI